MKYKWGNHFGETYKPKYNQKRRVAIICSALISELILPFGLGLISHNKFLAKNPGWLFR